MFEYSTCSVPVHTHMFYHSTHPNTVFEHTHPVFEYSTCSNTVHVCIEYSIHKIYLDLDLNLDWPKLRPRPWSKPRPRPRPWPKPRPRP